MNIFMTGATGYIGRAVARHLRAAGHEVTALVRADSDTARLRDSGVALVLGDLGDLTDTDKFTPILEQFDAFIHTAQSRQNMVANDRAAIDAFSSQRGREAMFIYTSGVWVFGSTGDRIVDERSEVNPLAIVAWRPPHEQLVLQADNGKFRTAVLRPGCVYGGRQSMLADFFSAAEQGKPMTMVGDGNNRWSLIDLEDLADCYLTLVESRASGIFHATDDSSDSLRTIAEKIARAGGREPLFEHVPVPAARLKSGPFVDALIVDQRVSSAETRRRLDWKLSCPTFDTELEKQWKDWRTSATNG